MSRMEETVGRWQMLWNLRIPTIAQVHGYCVAGGTDLALHCDMIVAAEDARIGFTPVRAMGTPPTHMWLYSVGPQWAKRLLLTGDLIDGKTARILAGLLRRYLPRRWRRQPSLRRDQSYWQRSADREQTW
jgi:enoyl-CoA hydratase